MGNLGIMEKAGLSKGFMGSPKGVWKRSLGSKFLTKEF